MTDRSIESINEKRHTFFYTERDFQAISSFSSVQSLSRVRLFATPWIAARQASLSITNSRNSRKLTPSSQWCHPAISSSVVPFSSWPKSLPASESFPMNQLCMRWPKYWSFSFSIIPSKKSQGWSLSEWTGWISLQSNLLNRLPNKHTHSHAQVKIFYDKEKQYIITIKSKIKVKK